MVELKLHLPAVQTRVSDQALRAISQIAWFFMDAAKIVEQSEPKEFFGNPANDASARSLSRYCISTRHDHDGAI